MSEIIEIETERLILRQWKAEDKPLFAKINADPAVMEFFPEVWTQQRSDEAVDKCQSLIEDNGWGFWAVETMGDNKFIGFTGLNQPEYKLPADSCVEIGWRLAKDSWGQGCATEAARACLDFAFENLVLDEVYSFTSVSNKRSRAVMERLKMIKQNSNFDHPLVPEGHALCEHVLYKIELKQWKEINSGSN